ncbi:MAG: hypothetical protein J6Y94_02385 [Bacteriovoracaceae bacterium]|nr:hypothetical protein [Bacteriovoracaceae bacterium]
MGGGHPKINFTDIACCTRVKAWRGTFIHAAAPKMAACFVGQVRKLINLIQQAIKS